LRKFPTAISRLRRSSRSIGSSQKHSRAGLMFRAPTPRTRQASKKTVRRESRIHAERFLSGTGSYTSGRLNVTTLLAVDQEASTVLLGVNRPLYDGGKRRAKAVRKRHSKHVPRVS
jgi:hypothetical protein